MLTFRLTEFTNSNQFKHLSSTAIKSLDTIVPAAKVLDLDHDSMKALREKINSGYVKHGEKLMEGLREMFTGVEGGEFRHETAKMELKKDKTQLDKSVAAMYKELYERVELEENFESEYESWANQEVFMFDVY